MADKSKTGMEFPEFSFELERGKIRELVQAIGDTNAVYVDQVTAQQEGYKDTPAPPTFVTLPVMWSSMLFRALKDLDIGLNKVLHGEESYTYFQEVYPGDILTGRMKVVSMDTKSGKSGEIDLISLETVYRNQKEEQVIQANTLIVERK